MFRSSVKCALILALLSLPLLAAHAHRGSSIKNLRSKKQLVSERELAGISPGRRKLTGLHPQTAAKMQAALSEMKRAGLCPTITSAYRSSAQQQAIYSCAHRHQCRARRGIYGARKPGTSLHEAGLAVDLADVAHGKKRRYLTRDGKRMVKIMQRHGFKWRYGLKDPAHFEQDIQTAGFRNTQRAILAAQNRVARQQRSIIRRRS